MNNLPVAPIKRRYFFRFNAADVNARRDLAAVFTPLIEQARAQSAIVYRADQDSGAEDEFRAVAARASAVPKIPELGVTVGEEATAILRRSTDPFQTSLSEEALFANLPEVLQFGVRRVLILPLRAGDSLLGFMTVGRTAPELFGAQAIEVALPIARVAAAVLERDALHSELRERKLVERAKGLIQRRRGISEEDAYMFLRAQSRRSRRPMAQIAGEIIGAAALRPTA